MSIFLGMKNLTWFASLLFISSSIYSFPKDQNHLFNKMADRYFEYYFKTYPTHATQAGIHIYDNDLENFSKKEIQNQILNLKKFLSELKKIHPRDFDLRIDYEVLIHHMQALLLDLETIRMWEKNPDQYNGIISQSIYLLVSRNFAPASERLKSVIARQKKSHFSLKWLEIT